VPVVIWLRSRFDVELDGFSAKEKKMYIVEKVRSCISGKSKKGYYRFVWTVGSNPGIVKAKVCRRSFCNAYCCGLTYVKVLISKLKAGDRSLDIVLCHSRPAVGPAFVKQLISLAATFNIELTPLQLSGLMVPNTVASLSCIAWMKAFFDAVGDQPPNHHEIHLEPTGIKVVHAEYHHVIGDAGEPVLEYSSF
jgi:hypothetical protein